MQGSSVKAFWMSCVFPTRRRPVTTVKRAAFAARLLSRLKYAISLSLSKNLICTAQNCNRRFRTVCFLYYSARMHECPAIGEWICMDWRIFAQVYSNFFAKNGKNLQSRDLASYGIFGMAYYIIFMSLLPPAAAFFPSSSSRYV